MPSSQVEAASPAASAAAVPASARSNVPATVAPWQALRTAPSPAPKPVATSVPAGPAIYSASASSGVVHAGGSVLWTVRTSADVVSVTASTPLYSIAFNRSSPGLFQATFGIPANAPPLFHGSYTLSIVGTDAAGRTASSSLPMRFE